MPSNSRDKSLPNVPPGTRSRFQHVQNFFVCYKRGKYNLSDREKPKNTNCLERFVKKLRIKVKRKHDKLSNDERYWLSLYNEGLLESNYVIREDHGGKASSILLVHEHPVINICYGFPDSEIRRSKRLGGGSYNNLPEVCVLSGINKVLQEDFCVDDEPRIDDIPISIWQEVLEPAIQNLLIMKYSSRTNRTNITKRRKESPLHRSTRVVIGDVQETYFMIGPHVNAAQHRMGLFALFAHRIGELGERHRRTRNHRLADAVLPLTSTTVRGSNVSRSRTTRANPNFRRYGSNDNLSNQVQGSVSRRPEARDYNENHSQPANMVFH